MRRSGCLLVAMFSLHLTIPAARAQDDPSCTPPPANLVAWWPGDGDATDLQDGHDGALTGDATFAAGKVGRAFSFDSTGDAVLVPHGADLNPTGAFSVDAWIKAEAPQSSPQSVVVDKSHGFNDGTGWLLQSNPDGTMGFGFGKGGNSGDPSNFPGVSSTTGVMDGQWHHIAGVFTGTQFEIYLDGALDNTFAFSGTYVGNTREVEIGRSWGGGNPQRFFHGLIDEVEYFDAALSAADVEAMFAAGTAGKCKPEPCGPSQCRDVDQLCKSCGQPLGTGATPTASDALGILRTAIGARQCRLCVCDVDGSGAVVASDALLTLKRAVGQNITLECPAGPPTPSTTTTSAPLPSSTTLPATTTTISSASTTIVPVTTSITTSTTTSTTTTTTLGPCTIDFAICTEDACSCGPIAGIDYHVANSSGSITGPEGTEVHVNISVLAGGQLDCGGWTRIGASERTGCDVIGCCRHDAGQPDTIQWTVFEVIDLPCTCPNNPDAGNLKHNLLVQCLFPPASVVEKEQQSSGCS